MRGGTCRLLLVGDIYQGLSPRARGNHKASDTAIADEGSIPACAGEPRFRTMKSEKATVYPRVRGGTRAKDALLVIDDGLSPRARGNPRMVLEVRACDGSIPACAGEPRLAGRVFR